MSENRVTAPDALPENLNLDFSQRLAINTAEMAFDGFNFQWAWSSGWVAGEVV